MALSQLLASFHLDTDLLPAPLSLVPSRRPSTRPPDSPFIDARLMVVDGIHGLLEVDLHPRQAGDLVANISPPSRMF